MVAHPNPALATALQSLLPPTSGVLVTPPLPYPAMLGLLSQATVVVTDSGGIQEEAATLGVALLITREATERPEAIDCGIGTLVGTDPDRIVAEAERHLVGPVPAWPTTTPFGDGNAAGRCVDAIVDLLDRRAQVGLADDSTVRLAAAPVKQTA